MKKIISITLLVLFMSCNKSTTTSEKSLNAESQTVISEFMALVNSHRKSLGLKALTHVDPMALIAQGHSDDMASGSVAFGHDGFSDRCADARQAMNGGNFCAENVAQGQKTAQAVFNSWMNSPSHRANIESARVTHCGLGYALSSSGSPYWTNLLLEI